MIDIIKCDNPALPGPPPGRVLPGRVSPTWMGRPGRVPPGYMAQPGRVPPQRAYTHTLVRNIKCMLNQYHGSRVGHQNKIKVPSKSRT